MQISLSSKGQIVLPAPVRRRLKLKKRAKLELEERDGGLFLRPAKADPLIEPIAYPPPGSLKLDKWEHDLMNRSSDAGPGET
ncbi:MAG: AbrB/MazE/SpoVT family DNA-binding domain-containing protein [Opitutus sp.]